MPKKLSLILCLAVAAMVLSPVFAVAGVPEAVTYLKAQTQDAWTTMALVAAGETNVNADHLKSVSGTLATDYAKTILALAAAGKDPKTFGNIDYVAKLKTYYASGQFGEATLINDDIWSLLALASVKDTAGQEFSDAKAFILAHQNADGGWSYSVTGQSDTNDTAAAMMALIEAGVGAADETIAKAVAYLKTAQNDDGGFGYQPGNASDSGSDAWVISAVRKLGQDPVTWVKGANNPVSHLQSLQDTDGGFWWVTPGSSEFNNKAMTAFAVIALAGKTYPVGYYQAPAAGNYHLRLEGAASTICDTNVSGTTAMDLIKNAATACGYTYNITQESYGLYLRSINSEAAAGMAGWLYFVNNVSPPVGAGSYNLASGDEVLFYYGEWGWNPSKITLDKASASAGETVNATIQYYNGTAWLPLPNAAVKVGAETKTATAAGTLQITIPQNGIYAVYADTAGFVRSEKKTLNIGAEVSQTVGLSAEIEQSPGSPAAAGSSVALIVTPNQLNFGKLRPGQSATQNISVSNSGTGNLNLGSTVTGDSVFTSGIKIDGSAWSSYSATLSAGQNKSAPVSLSVPANYLASGVKNGELIIWATSGN